ncbi:hypothetical protein Hdeb2414_s0008g00269821 [Helianthus debilis subsp. tardiflorus]
MAEPSNPHNVEGENPEQPIVAEEEDDDDVEVAGGGLPVLKWSKTGFKNLMTTVRMSDDWDATYPQEGDTGADAPAGYITMWADFFIDGNLRLPVTVFVAEILEYYRLHILNLARLVCSELGTLNIPSGPIICPLLLKTSGGSTN